MEKLNIWYVDDNMKQARIYGRILNENITDEVQVQLLCPPFEKKEDYLNILSDNNTVGIILDQKLMDQVTYSGIELAKYLRSINSKLPLYILTNFADSTDQFAESEWSVEDIIPKDELQGNIIKHVARIVRRINVYKDILSTREKRFNELLRKSLYESLSSDEITEFENLQATRTLPVLADELSQLAELDAIAKKYREILNKFDKRGDEL